MTKFFIPDMDTDEKRDILFDSIAKFAKETIGWNTTNRKIFKIYYQHDGRNEEAEVGQKTKVNNELVYAILETETVYFICTANRGVLRGEPILVGKHDTHKIIDFDE